MIGVLGGGITGLTFAHLVKDSEVLEGDSTFGGLCRSIYDRGYTFDLGSHIVFSRNKEVLDFQLDLLGNNKIKHKRNTKVLYGGKLVKYPFENGLGDLEKQEAFDCLADYVDTYIEREKGSLAKPQNFKEWMYYRFGKSICDKYLYPYNAKIWDYNLSKMALFWVEGRIPQPPTRDVIKAAMDMESEGYTHQLYFYYPSKGGFQALSDSLVSKIEKERLHSSFKIEKIKRENNKWVVKSNSGQEKIYNKIVNTFHIQDFFRTLEDVPQDVQDAVDNLKWNSAYLTMIGVNKKLNDFHWMYLPDKEILPNRISFPSNMSPHNVPKGKSSILSETTFSPKGEKSKLGKDKVNETVVEQMGKALGFSDDEVDYSKTIVGKYVYVVYDLDYEKNIQKIYDYVKEIDVTLAGRFAEFRYYNSDKCVESAMEKAKLFS